MNEDSDEWYFWWIYLKSLINSFSSISNNSDIYFISLQHEFGKIDKDGNILFLKSENDFSKSYPSILK